VAPDCGCFEADVIEVGSTGRFWGYTSLRPVLSVRQVTPDVGLRAGRVLRRWYHPKGLTRRIRREHVDQATGRITRRATTVRKRLFRGEPQLRNRQRRPAMAARRPAASE